MSSRGARLGALYDQLLLGEISFNGSYSNIDARIYGNCNVSCSIGKNGDSFLLLSGEYNPFTGDSSRFGLLGGEIAEIGFYKNGSFKDYGDGVYDVDFDNYFEQEQNHSSLALSRRFVDIL